MKIDSIRYDASWVQSALKQCIYLETVKSVDADAKFVIEFAIRWAPFGGASAGDLLVAFGATRLRFLQLVREALDPRPDDDPHARALKRDLVGSLSWAWLVCTDSAAPYTIGWLSQ
ncbi:hypothetical protein [Nocardia sp. NPDC059691]|uniref:hypothetical protein n=1 Tax=Nocardia sp. NPDC059691 TaxID=3346908 RepID=UPI00368855E5